MIKVESVTVTMTMTGEDYRDLCDYMDFAKKHREEQNPVDREEDGGADHAEEMPEESEAPAEQEEAQEADTDPEEDPDDEEDEDDEEDDGPGDLDEAVKKILALSKKHPFICPDCFDRLQRLDLEDQLDELIREEVVAMSAKE